MSRTFVGIAILLAYVTSILYAQLFTDNRIFCFAMFSKLIGYEIEARVNGHLLSPTEVMERYEKPIKGIHGGSVLQIMNLIRGSERRSSDGVFVTLRCRVNGKAEQEWVYRE